jgi:hypothetical protein
VFGWEVLVSPLRSARSRSGTARGRHWRTALRQRYGLLTGSVECILCTWAMITVTVLKGRITALSPLGSAFLPS